MGREGGREGGKLMKEEWEGESEGREEGRICVFPRSVQDKREIQKKVYEM